MSDLEERTVKISVIIPLKNEVKFLQDCLDSLEDQTCKDFEAIIVCAGSKAEDVEAVKSREVSFPVKVVVMEGDVNVAMARNEGIRNSQGEFVFFLDCDDYLEDIAFEWLLERAADHDVVLGRKKTTWFGRKTFLDKREKARQEKQELLEQENSEEEEDGAASGADKDERIIPEIRESDEEWIKAFDHVVRSNFMITGVSALGILIRRSYLEEHDIYFDESYIYNADLPFFTKMMRYTDQVIEVRTIFYRKRRHNDPINQPALNQIQDQKTKLMEVMRAYLLMKEDVKGRDERADISVDGKFIRYYVRRVARFYVQCEDKKDREEVYQMASQCLPHVTKAAAKRAMHYSQRLLKYSASHSVDEIAVKVRRHSARQTLFRNIKSRRGMEKLLYRKVFVKSKLEKNTVMFECFFGRNYSDSPKYIYEYLAKNYPDEYQFVWVVAKRTKIPYKAKTVKRFSLRYFYYMAKAGYFVFNVRQPNWFIKRDGVKFLETWHGTPLKKLAFDQEEVTSASPMYKKNTYIGSRNWDYLIAPNKFSSDIFKQCFMFDKTMLETGYPRNDILYSKGEEKDRLVHEIKDELGLPKDKKVILYAPTWRDDEFYGSGQYKFTLELDLDRLKKEFGDEYVIVLRTHYYVVDALDLTPYKGFVYNGSVYNDIARLYLISDVLITDYSSVFFDYANLRRPMIFFMYDLEKYRGTLRGFYFDAEAELPGPILQTNDEMVDAIRHLDQIEVDYKEKYDAFYDKYCAWEDGTSTEKVVKAVFGK